MKNQEVTSGRNATLNPAPKNLTFWAAGNQNYVRKDEQRENGGGQNYRVINHGDRNPSLLERNIYGESLKGQLGENRTRGVKSLKLK